MQSHTLLGYGGYSKVYLVEYDQREYAVKCLRTSQQGVISPLEIDILCRYRHPHLISAEAFYVLTEPRDYLQLWLPRGRPLTPADRKDAKKICWQVTTALAFLHHEGILHLDIDPVNILYIPDKDVYQLIDLSLARYQRHSRGDTPTTILSSRAPELLSAELHEEGIYPLTPACDIWSLGLLFLRIFTGMPMLHARNNPRDQHQVFEHFFGTPQHSRISLSPWLEDEVLLDLLSQMLAWIPSDRPSAQEILAHPYFQDLRTTLPSGRVIPEVVPFNPSFDFKIGEELIEPYLLEHNLTLRVIIRGVDLFYRFITISGQKKQRYLRSCLLLACKLEEIYSIETTLSYIRDEKEIMSALKGGLAPPLRSTYALLSLQGYYVSPLFEDKDFLDQVYTREVFSRFF
jgi:serine/threonine protein kinase